MAEGKTRPLGLPDDAFAQRRPLRGQITKREARAVSLYALGLRPDSIVWDIGAGTGSVAIEAGLLAWLGQVYAVERDPDSLPLLQANIAQWGTGNVQLVAGAAPEALAALPDPDAVFVGGSGGKLAAILETAARRLRPGGRLVVNLAALERVAETTRQLACLGFACELSMVQASRGKPLPDGTLRLEALNPVFVVAAWREG